MATNNPMAALPPAPAVSVRAVHMAGLLVDVYGLAELPPAAETVSVLWLHHPRLRARGDMADIAARCVAGWNDSLKEEKGGGNGNGNGKKRGLIAAAFDQRNHGSRLADARANESWRDGNPTHAQDMFGIVAGTVADTRVLIGLVEAYLFPPPGPEAEGAAAAAAAAASPPPPPPPRIVQHLVLGVSLGGHSAWQLLFSDPRVNAGAMVIGCPDYMYLQQDRARLSRLATYRAADAGASFPGSRDFPPSLVQACREADPRGILFGTGKASWPSPSASSSSSEQEDGERRLHDELQSRISNKRFLVCSGADDKLVPYRCSEPVLDVLKRAARTWPELGLGVDDRVYAGTAHVFSADMVRDAVRFVVEAVEADDEGGVRVGAGAKEDEVSRIKSRY